MNASLSILSLVPLNFLFLSIFTRFDLWFLGAVFYGELFASTAMEFLCTIWIFSRNSTASLATVWGLGHYGA
jgi:hypothetical protein